MRFDNFEIQHRRVVRCADCGKCREMAAHGLCFKCYRRNERRQKQAPEDGEDFHSPAIPRQLHKLLRANTALLKALADLKVTEKDLLTIRRVLDPYLLPISKFVALVDEKSARERRSSAIRQRLGVNTNSKIDVHSSLEPVEPAGEER